MKRTQLLAILALTAVSLSFPAARARGQAAPAPFFWVCYSAAAANEANVYVSGILQGPATAAAAFRVGFVQTLMQRYSYQGNAACVPARTAVAAQDDMNRRTTALRNTKKNVVATGWTEAAPAAASGASGTTGAITSPLGGLPLGGLIGGSSPVATPAAPAPSGTQPTPASGNPSGANAAQGQGANSTGGSTAASVLAALFGASPAPASSGSGGATAGKTTAAAAGKTAAGSAAGGTAAGGANTGAVTQVTSTLSSLFGNKGSGGAAPGGAGNAAKPGTPAANGSGGAPAGASAPNANAPGGLPQGALGSAQYQSTMLVVYGCGRQGTDGTQVLCVTDLTNQNAKDTLVQSANVWKDAFIVDDRGDRHTRTAGYFLNIDGEQRQQLDIDNGKSAHFILGFDGVPAKVEKITLRSATGGLAVNAISLIAVGATDASGQGQPSAAPAAPAQGQAAAGAAHR